MNVAQPRRRTRKTPEVRRTEILDAAARLVLVEGLSAVSMERLGRETGISKALVYNYFPSRDDLLAALLKREQDELRERGLGAVMRAQSYEDMIRSTTRIYLEQVEHRGALIQALLSDPSVVRLMEDESREAREKARKYLIRQTAKAYGLRSNVAAASVDLLWAVTDEAGRLVARKAISRADAEDFCVTLITGALEKLSGTG